MIPFAAAALLPAPGDNAAIASRRLEAGENFEVGGKLCVLRATILEGHRLAARDLAAGERLLSWGLPFGRTLRAVAAGEYLCNEKILRALSQRRVDFALPEAPNFEDIRTPFHFDETAFKPGAQVLLHPEPRHFQGYPRAGGRGAGTRNYLVVMAADSSANSIVRAVAERCQGALPPNVDGIVPVAHTERSSGRNSNNREIVLRTLAGFARNPNVGALVLVGPSEAVRQSILGEGGPRGEMVLSGGSFEQAVTEGVRRVELLLPVVASALRWECSAAQLKIGLQCGGSDAFSGVSGNPLVGWMARETVRCGGAANLAETDELIGAEQYVLANVRDLATARAFLRKVAEFQERAGWHGHSAEGNPSGGNLYRGLYNITIKSIGAALKKTADTRIDYVIDYGAAMAEPGFYFMDSPGNDLESIAGQVAAGCNMILFATGNGSITNFPFVPTLKVMTTTRRFEMLRREMDFNAGRHQDGEAMDDLGREAFELMLRTASGEPSVGERAGHAQVQIWRDWKQSGPGADLAPPPLSRQPISITGETLPADGLTWRGFQTENSWAHERVRLVVPTSLCAGQIGQMIAAAVQRQGGGRCVALAHTEGCGNSGGESETILLRTMAGYAAHPSVARVLMLEHGCEKTHNDAFRHCVQGRGANHCGWLSIQMDGGIEPVVAKARAFLDGFALAERLEAPLAGLGIGLASVDGTLPEALKMVARTIARAGGLVVSTGEGPTIDYGEPAPGRGWHVMRAPTEDFTEILTGLGATGVGLIVAWAGEGAGQGHPLVPTLQAGVSGPDLDFLAGGDGEAARLMDLILRTASGEYVPKALRQGRVDFQITRGLEGVSL